MATNQVEIVNMALVRLGEAKIAAMDEDSAQAVAANAIYDNVLSQTLAMGPEKGWKFATTRTKVDVDETAITAFADYSGTVPGTTSCTAAGHGLDSNESVNITGTTSYNGEYVITKIDADTFYFTETFVADDATGTVAWTSDEYEYRYAIPTSTERLVSVRVGGVELSDWVREDAYVLTNSEDETVEMVYVLSNTVTTTYPSHFTKVLYMQLAIELAYTLMQSATAAERLLLEFQEYVLPRAIARDEQGQYVEESSSAWVDAGR